MKGDKPTGTVRRMQRESVAAMARSAGQQVPIRPSQAVRGGGLDRPFYADKNRAFWILQSLGWSGYFILRFLTGIANNFGAILPSTA